VVTIPGGDVTKVGTPANNQVGVWTGDGTIEGNSDLTFDGTVLAFPTESTGVSFGSEGTIKSEFEGLVINAPGSGINITGAGLLVNVSGGVNITSESWALINDTYGEQVQWQIAGGLKYASDYSSNYTDRSLIDKQFATDEMTLLSTRLNRTITTAGTTGNQTINKMAGTVNIAAAGTTVTVTNSLVTTSSIIFCTLRTNDTTATIKNVVAGTGSFVITLGAAATAEVSIGFMVTN